MTMEFKKYRKKPLTVQAVLLAEPVEISTLEGVMVGNVGDYLIVGTRGEIYPCKPNIFEDIYEQVGAEPVIHCAWIIAGEHNFWGTDCGNGFELTRGTPRENGMRHCPFCGRPIFTVHEPATVAVPQ